MDGIIDENQEDKSNWRQRLLLVNERNRKGGQNENTSSRFDFTPRMDWTCRFDEIRIHAMKFGFTWMRVLFSLFFVSESKNLPTMLRILSKSRSFFHSSIINAYRGHCIEESARYLIEL